ncbi:hypothetical protein LP414_06415 [Polaromonas sp. P1(28)-13]|nr:hypothetical protein LP414_06415 [Polaromonas sp. P1(28)-13]
MTDPTKSNALATNCTETEITPHSPKQNFKTYAADQGRRRRPQDYPRGLPGRLAGHAGRHGRRRAVRVQAQGASVVGSSLADTASIHRREMAKFKRAVEISGAKAE